MTGRYNELTDLLEGSEGVVTYCADDFLPLKGRCESERRMRVHQQWWGWTRLGRRMGQPAPKVPFPVLTLAEQQEPATSNFLTTAIHRLATSAPGLASFAHFNHLLSSMPLAINLFDADTPFRASTPLDVAFGAALRTPFAPSSKSHQLVSTLLGRTVEVLRIDFEIPGRLRLRAGGHPLLDKTSFDVVVEFRDASGLGLLAIETKLTEPLSNGGDLLDPTRRYRALFDAPGSPFRGPLSAELQLELARHSLVQWVRNHLLAFGVCQLGGYASHSYWAVFPSSHKDAVAAAQVYSTKLRSPKVCFAAVTIESIIDKWSPHLTTADELQWCQGFRERYLAIESSELLWKALSLSSARVRLRP